MTAIGQLAQEVARTNPWWRDPSWAATDPDLNAARSTGLDYRPDCLSSLTAGSLYTLRGPRRVGKTVATKQAIEDLLASGVAPTAIVRVAVDGWQSRELRTITQNTSLPRKPPDQSRWWFIDEITSVSGQWQDTIKWLRDNDPDFGEATVVLTGSNARNLTEAVGTLAGRRGSAVDVDRTLLPIGFRTFAELLDPTLRSVTPRLALSELRSEAARAAYDELIPWLDILVQTLEQYLLCGGFPEAVAGARVGQGVPQRLVDDLFDIVFRDAFADTQFSELQTTQLLARLAKGLTSPSNANSIAEDVDTSPDTVRRRIGDLRNAYLVWPCPQLGRVDRWAPRAGAQDKLYFVDPLIARLAHLRAPGNEAPDVTKLAENQIGVSLRRRLEHDHPGHWANHDKVLYWKTKTRNEIDFVSEALAGAAIEGKYTEGGGWAGETATVNAAAWAGILATRNVLDTSADGDDAWAVPAAFVTYLIDT